MTSTLECAINLFTFLPWFVLCPLPEIRYLTCPFCLSSHVYISHLRLRPDGWCRYVKQTRYKKNLELPSIFLVFGKNWIQRNISLLLKRIHQSWLWMATDSTREAVWWSKLEITVAQLQPIVMQECRLCFTRSNFLWYCTTLHRSNICLLEFKNHCSGQKQHKTSVSATMSSWLATSNLRCSPNIILRVLNPLQVYQLEGPPHTHLPSHLPLVPIDILNLMLLVQSYLIFLVRLEVPQGQGLSCFSLSSP